MSSTVFPPRNLPELPIAGEDHTYQVARIFCVGRNYAAHAAEMGGEVDREAPWYFTKSAFALCHSGATVPYPPGTSNYHHEMELAVALGTPIFRGTVEEVEGCIFGYACALDMTRRDRQQDGKDHRRPWSLGKDVENSAVVAPITRSETFGAVADQPIRLKVNGERRQDAVLSDMVWRVEEIIAHLSGYYHLGPGDIILTGTPAGVGPVVPGDSIRGTIEGLAVVSLKLADSE